jgi:anti-sigma factor RsiW
MTKDLMDHSEVRELLEDAAIEPGGLDRLMAGDTPTASIVAGHLAGCDECAEELERLRRSVGLIQPTVRAVPPPELRARTLAYVAALGRPRGGASDVPTITSAVPVVAPVSTPVVPVGSAEPSPVTPFAPAAGRRRDRRLRIGWVASLAAALIVAVGGTTLVLNADHSTTSARLFDEIDALGDVARWTLRVDAQPDVRRIQLASATGSQATGTLVFSPTSTELVIVADHLAPAPAGREYRCWVERGGQRSAIGKMFFGGSLAYWVGDVPQVAGLAPGARFGVSLVDLGTNGAPSEPVLIAD